MCVLQELSKELKATAGHRGGGPFPGTEEGHGNKGAVPPAAQHRVEVRLCSPHCPSVLRPFLAK